MENAHAATQAHAHGHDIQKEVKRYIAVFIALMALTAVTVGISYLHLPVHIAIVIALIVATIKGGMVACYFMHLISERTLIYGILAFVVFNFFGMMLLIYFGYFDLISGSKFVS